MLTPRRAVKVPPHIWAEERTPLGLERRCGRPRPPAPSANHQRGGVRCKKMESLGHLCVLQEIMRDFLVESLFSVDTGIGGESDTKTCPLLRSLWGHVDIDLRKGLTVVVKQDFQLRPVVRPYMQLGSVQDDDVQLAGTVGAFDQLVSDIGCLAGTGDDHRIARQAEGRVASRHLRRAPVFEVSMQLVGGH